MIHRTIFNSREKLERFLRCLREWPGKEDELAHYGHRSMDRRWRYLALRYKEQFNRTIHTGRIHKKLSGVAAEMFAITG